MQGNTAMYQSTVTDQCATGDRKRTYHSTLRSASQHVQHAAALPHLYVVFIVSEGTIYLHTYLERVTDSSDINYKALSDI